MRSTLPTTLLLIGLATLALAAPAAAEPGPQWSGLDARAYASAIPTEGGLITSVPLDPALSVTGAARAFRILYVTPDQHARPAVSTAAVFVPRGAPPAGGWPVIAWAHGTVGLGDDCTPSARPRSQRDNQYLSHWLDQGYVVVGTDYVGLGTPGLMSYLNSAWWATRLTAGTGLDYRGVVATGTPANIERIVMEPGPDLPPQSVPPAAISYTSYIVAALREALPAIPFDGVLTPGGRELADQAETVCKTELDRQAAGTRLNELFSAPVSSLDGIGTALDGFMGTPTDGYDRPIFLGHGLRDTDVPPRSSQTLYQQLIDNHQNVELRIYPDQDHSGTVLASMPDSTRFLHQLMTG